MEVAVLGATGDGRAIASQCALAGHAVGLHDGDANVVMDAIDAIEQRHGDEALAAIDGTTGLDAAVGDADVVVDATEGDERTRRELVADVEETVGDETLIATSGAAVSVTGVAAGLRKPGRAVGLHFVDPDESSLVEVVVADQTAETARERAVEFVEGLDGTPLVVRDVPSFASTRLDLALIVEAVRMVEEGVASVPDVDRALELGRDHPAGPLALADEIGLGNVLEALEDLANRVGGRFDPPGLLREKVNDGSLGVTTGEGFYEWENGERVGPADPNPVVRGRPDPESDAGTPPEPGGPMGSDDG
ncbi:3-hydroxyacyl-CoA dehydrogenase family protein [Halobacteria archaeon HArc-gm2]|nr:3-hydroxyacyl-CoA dehydrogenase family protein [Halobacteria archaeon HArc-gm2]